MSNFILTWYGITDLRASLGFEKRGPVLSALLTGKFSHAIILAYVNKNKEVVSRDLPTFKSKKISKKNFVEKFIEFFSKNETEKESSRSYFKNLSDAEAYSYVEKISNTPQANQYFKAWLEGQLSAMSKKVEIDVREVHLEELNDTDRIYGATLEAFNLIRKKKSPGDTVSVFLSPGTPVMAFSWALGAIRNPDMDIKIVSSSSLKKSLENISLPAGLDNLEVQELNMSKPGKFDAIFHLLGAEPLPTIFAINQFQCDNHVFVTSPPYNADNVIQFISSDAKYDTLAVNPYSPSDAEKKISSYIKDHNWKVIGFNLTGGTKLMYDGAMKACKKASAIPFYFEAEKHSLIWLNSYISEEINGIGKIDDFFAAKGYKILNPGKLTPEMEKRKKTTELLWKNKRAISSLYKDILEKCRDKHGKVDKYKTYKVFDKKNNFVSFDARNGEIQLCNSRFPFSHTLSDCEDFTKYITGGWFEEYVYWQLKPLLDSKIFDMRIGLEISSKDNSNTLQEFDVIFTDHKRLYIIECKAGNYDSSAVEKLQNNISIYGGTVGRGCLAACFNPFGKTKQSIDNRIGNDPRIIYLCEEKIVSELKSIIELSNEKANLGKNGKPRNIPPKKSDVRAGLLRDLSRAMDE